MEQLSEILDSRQVIEGDVLYTGSLAAAWNRLAHNGGYNAMVVCRCGQVAVEIGGCREGASAGQLLLIPTGKAVRPIEASDDAEAHVLLISDKMLKQLLGTHVSLWYRALYIERIYLVSGADWLQTVEHFAQTVLRLHGEMHFREEILEGVLRMALLLVCEELLRHDRMAAASDMTSAGRDQQVFNGFLMLLHHQEQKKLGVAFYAGQLNITPKYLCNVCKQVSGKSPTQWIRESVLQDCYTLLKDTDLPVKIISYRLGFPNSSFFGKYFRRATGMTPVAYRNKVKACQT